MYEEEIICEECGSDNVKITKSYEFSDADGNRGMWVTFIECRDCGWEDSSG